MACEVVMVDVVRCSGGGGGSKGVRPVKVGSRREMGCEVRGRGIFSVLVHI